MPAARLRLDQPAPWSREQNPRAPRGFCSLDHGAGWRDALRRLTDHVHPRHFELHRVQLVVRRVENDR
jgi:hypothetical protein